MHALRNRLNKESNFRIGLRQAIISRYSGSYFTTPGSGLVGCLAASPLARSIGPSSGASEQIITDGLGMLPARSSMVRMHRATGDSGFGLKMPVLAWCLRCELSVMRE